MSWPRRWLLALAPAALGMAARRAHAEAPPPVPDKPFAEHRLALQLSDRDPAKRAFVISTANNVLAAYGPDKVAIEVVALGPGIDLLRADSPDRVGVDSLVSQGVRFDVCMNTVATVERETGRKVALNPRAHPVQVGVAHLLTLAERGYTIVRP